MAVRECTRRAIEKYDAENYKSFHIKLRVEEDADIINDLLLCRSEGRKYRDFISDLYRGTGTYTREQIIDAFKDFKGVLTEQMVIRILDDIK